MAMAITYAASFGIKSVLNSRKAKDWRKFKVIRVVRGSRGDKNYSLKVGYQYNRNLPERTQIGSNDAGGSETRPVLVQTVTIKFFPPLVLCRCGMFLKSKEL